MNLTKVRRVFETRHARVAPKIGADPVLPIQEVGTAIFPSCGLVSVLGDQTERVLTNEFLVQMQQKLFDKLVQIHVQIRSQEKPVFTFELVSQSGGTKNTLRLNHCQSKVALGQL